MKDPLKDAIIAELTNSIGYEMHDDAPEVHDETGPVINVSDEWTARAKRTAERVFDEQIARFLVGKMPSPGLWLPFGPIKFGAIPESLTIKIESEDLLPVAGETITGITIETGPVTSTLPGLQHLNEPLEAQVDRLAEFIMHEVPGEPSQSQGAVDTAIRMIRELLAQKAIHDELVLAWAKDAGKPVPLTEGGTKMVCSDCLSSHLSINTIDGVEYDWCEDCGTEVETEEVPA